MSGINLDNYVDVAERIDLFYERFPDGRLWAVPCEHHTTETRVCMVGFAARTPDDPLPAQDHSAVQVPGKTTYTRDSEIENASTSAVGRAIAYCGIGTRREGGKAHIASKEEVERKTGERIVDHSTGEVLVTEHGTVHLNPDKPTQDGKLRVGPDGQAQRGFRLVSDGRGVLVEARGEAADAYEPHDGDAIYVEGAMEDRQFQGRDGPVRYRVLVAAHIARADEAGVTPPAPASAARREAAR